MPSKHKEERAKTYNQFSMVRQKMSPLPEADNNSQSDGASGELKEEQKRRKNRRKMINAHTAKMGKNHISSHFKKSSQIFLPSLFRARCTPLEATDSSAHFSGSQKSRQDGWMCECESGRAMFEPCFTLCVCWLCPSLRFFDRRRSLVLFKRECKHVIQ